MVFFAGLVLAALACKVKSQWVPSELESPPTTGLSHTHFNCVNAIIISVIFL